MNLKNLACLAVLIASICLATSSLLAANVVTTANDTGAGSFRLVVADAPAGATVTFASGLSGQTILLASGEVAINSTVTIDASALAGGLILNGGDANRAFNLGGSAKVTLIGLTVTNCTTADAGGALYSSPGSTLHISRCTFAGNSGLEGGAILVDGTLLMDNSTFFGNNGGYGGALQCRYTSFLTNCTLSGNSAPSGGGGIFNKNTTLTLNNCIISGNVAAYTASGADIYSQNAALVYVNANLVQAVQHDNPSAADIGPVPLTSAPNLFPPGNFGGPTLTMPPQFGSPAIDAGGSTGLTIDQRGLTRPVGAHPDLGAVELQAGEAFYNPVLSSADSGPWTLRGAILGVPSGSLITFATNLTGQTITLTSTELDVNNNVSITGLGATNLAISGRNAMRAFNIGSGYTVNIFGLTIRNGQAANGTNSYATNGIGGAGANGGGILNSGILNLTNCVLASNSSGNGGAGNPPVNPAFGTPGTAGGAGGNGGAIFNQGALRLSGCTLSGNITGAGGLGGFGNFTTNVGGMGGQGGSGAGIYNQAGASTTLANCTLAGNSAGGGGSGGYGNPGGIDGNGGNGGSGGAIYSVGSLSLAACTIVSNLPGAAGGPGQYGGGSPIPGTNGIAGGVDNSKGSVTCDSSIIALNTAATAPDVYGPFNSNGHNLVGKIDGSTGFGATGDIVGTVAAPVNPLLGALQLNGGQTATLALQPGSPAIEAGDDTLTGTDQRGFPRLNGEHVDIGAYELDISGFPPLSITPLAQTLAVPSPVTGNYPVTFSAAINPGGFITTADVQYGLTTNYGGTASLSFPAFGLVPVNVSNAVSGFAPGVVYHFRFVATNTEGNVTSPDLVFQTPAKYLLGDANGDGVVDQNEFNAVLQHYLATSPYLLITNTLGLGQTNVTFALSNATAGNYLVQYSPDLVNWYNLGPATPRYYFTDTNAPGLPQRYYRLAPLPNP